MIYRVIISHGQTGTIQMFPSRYPSVFVFDTPTNEDVATCIRSGHDYAIVPFSGNRSVNRNTGLAYIISKYAPGEGDAIEFFDGDRYPLYYARQCVSAMLSKTDTLLYTCQKDSRFERISVPDEGAILCDTGRLCNPFYSCGFVMKMPAIRKIMEFNKGHFFSPKFTRWGCEDQYLGVECANLGIDVSITREIIINGSVGGDSSAHSDYRDALQQYIDLIRANGFVMR